MTSIEELLWLAHAYMVSESFFDKTIFQGKQKFLLKIKEYISTMKTWPNDLHPNIQKKNCTFQSLLT